MALRQSFLLLLLIGGVIGCGDATQVTVRVRSQLPGTASFRIQVAGASNKAELNQAQFNQDIRLSVPRVAIVPEGGDASRFFRITATALDENGQELGQVEGTAGFIECEHRHWLLEITSDCGLGTERCVVDREAASLDTAPPRLDVQFDDAGADSGDAQADVSTDAISDVSQDTEMDAMPDVMDAMPDVMDAMPDVVDAMPDVMDAMPDVMDAMPDVMDAMPDVMDASMECLPSVEPIVAHHIDSATLPIRDRGMAGPNVPLSSSTGDVTLGPSGATFLAPGGEEETSGGRLSALATPSNELVEHFESASSLSVFVRLELNDSELEGSDGDPRRIVTLSQNAQRRAFTLGQRDDELIFRVRTLATDCNGSSAAGDPPCGRDNAAPPLVLEAGLSEERGFIEVLFVFDPADSTARLYVDGLLRDMQTHVLDSRRPPFDWNRAAADGGDEGHILALGDELGVEADERRRFHGTISDVAIYDQVLTPAAASLNNTCIAIRP